MSRSFLLGVAGESHPNRDGTSRQQIIRRCRAGDPVTLEPEPDNPYDNLAVKVLHEAGQVGYLPAGHGLTRAIHRGVASATIFRTTGGGWFLAPKTRSVVLQITRSDQD